ncbi:Bromo adjacent y domain containing 1 [Fasciola gigantica]|uniref:Bromo adjacent y domain containing 1 n=1 Tax=Fasciola gigantica TaxID=46835 RepID=A0A504YAG1_FASGI|nr:Bromo adjacent y domain containing 1 [Fasciola gigantica]
MRTRMTNNVRKKALRVLKAQRSKTDRLSANVASSETVRKKSNRSTKRAKKSGKIAKYKEIHSVGRRTSSQFVTYSQDGRLFYDLYARYTPYTSSIKAANTSTSSFIPNIGAPHGSIKQQESSEITASILLANQVPTQTRSASRKQNASTKEENRTSLERTINQRKNAARPRRANLVSQKHSKQNTVTKKAAAKVRLQRKLKRELGLDVIPKMQTVSKRLASINAVAIINAVTRDGSKRLITGVKSTAARRRDSSDTTPCVDSKIERVQEDSSVHSDDALTEPMSQSPSAASMNKSVVHTPTSPLSPILCTSSPSIKKTKVTQTSIRMKKSSLPTVPPVTPGCITSSAAKTLVTSTPCRELVAAKPQTSAVESYHTERLIPLGHSGFGFQQITTQVIRYAQPDCSTLENTNPVLTQVSQATSAANPTTVPVVIRTPGDLVQNMHASDFFNTNRTQTFLSNMALPMLTPMPTLTTWPTIIHPYTHMIQPLHTQLAQPNSAIFIPSLIPVPTQFHYSMMPNMFHHHLNRSPTLLSSAPLSPHAPLPPPPLPSLVPSPMCSLSTVQPTIAPSFGVLRSVPPTLYYSLSSPPFPLRDSAVPLHTSVPAMTACTSSPSLQLPVCNQPIFTPPTPQSVSISLPPLSQDPHFVPTCTFIPSPSPLNAFNFSTSTVPSAMTPNPTDGQLSQSDSSITSMGLNTGLGVSVTLLHPVIQSTTSTSTPVSHMVNRSLPNGNITSPIITLLSSDKTEQKLTTSTQSSVPLTALPNAETTSSSDSPTITLEPVVLCAVDGSQNAWQWEGSSYTKAVFCRSDGPPVVRTCYPAIRHRRDGMVIREKDCVLLCSGPDRSNPPHVAKITALFADVTNLGMLPLSVRRDLNSISHYYLWFHPVC